ncbi:MAG: HlyD family efflux transporter periplasmic adaptor subunit [Proteobacteria bacterium]|nr:HlyD family efflux transporter periplasmic adaptor subunit [Pseudomonadota bacterium]
MPTPPGVWSQIRIVKALRLSMRLITIGLAVFAAVMLFLPWVQTAAGTGRITSLYPEGQPQKIHALVKGRIKKWYVRDGSKVAKDDPIVEIVDNDPMLLERLEAEAAAARKGRDAAQMAAKTAMIDLDRKKDLFERGLAARREWEQARIEYESWLAKEAEATAKIAGAETKLSRQQTQLVRAPADGIIIQTSIGDAATMVSEGDTVATFAPANTVKAAELYLRGLDMPLVQPGRKVRLQFEGWPSVQFSGWPATAIGTFGGEVAVIAPSISENGKFRILVTEDPKEPWPADAYLRFGSQVNGWVLLDTVPVGYELWRQMNNFPPENPARKNLPAITTKAEEKEKAK